MKKRITFWQYFAISLSVVAGTLAANFKTNAAQSLNVEAVTKSTVEFKLPKRHFILLEQRNCLTVRSATALED
ncbi:hypothetical protein [Rheinheimera metallidurans]|uniref:hypothetical protein n=1 Tax=Rheinheimera metallidurans TaxID=2925781 RepID=UPI003001B0B2